MRYIVSLILIFGLVACRSESGSDEGQESGFGFQQEPEALGAILASHGIESPADVARICDQKRNSWQVIERPLTFNARSGCRFGEAGNGSAEAGQLQAQEFTINRLRLPTNALLCQMKMESRSSRPVNFGDDIFFKLDRMILFSNNINVVNFLREEGERIVRWNFPQVRGRPVNPAQASTYCHRNAFFCIVNRNPENGFIRATLEPTEFADIAYELVGLSETQARLTVTGDSGENDCSHSDIILQIEMQYLTISPNGIL